MEVDYPAAHSMDALWFAVDRDGHVGYFESGAAGALPLDCFQEDAATRKWLSRLLPGTEPVHDVAGLTCPGPLDERGTHRDWVGEAEETLMFLDSLDPVRWHLARGEAVQVRAHTGVAVVFRKLSPATSKHLHRAGVCLGCALHSGLEEDERRDAPDYAARGLYVYSHLPACEDWIPGPYGLDRRPLRPAHIDQLPTELRHLVGFLRYDGLCFAQTPHLQPIEHETCISTLSSWLTADGTRIRENIDAVDEGLAPDEYAMEHAYLVCDLQGSKGITIDPPRQAGGGAADD